ncbi:galactokinase [Nocardioides perillae]|uniref:Galactokinase n=1 Tax=Nocardioides perillae TaxID=1119534 RepID=A0A7Y9RUD3_9ACTN|nr:galactokinase [Nocardioides perillae]
MTATPSAPSAGTASGTWSAPGRVNLVGDHTDYNDGLALPCALPFRTTVHAHAVETGERVLRASSAGHDDLEVALPGAPGEVAGWGAYVAGTAWALEHSDLLGGRPVPSAELRVSGDVPLGAGLSSSHALQCAVALALCGLAGVDDPDRDALVEVVRRVENDYVGAPTGTLDQSAILHGRTDHLLLFDARSGEVDPVPAPFDAAGAALVVVDSRAPHRLTDGAYAERREQCARAAQALGLAALRDLDVDGLPAAAEALVGLDDGEVLLRRARHVVTEDARVRAVVDLLRDGRREAVAAVGPELTASHLSLRDDFESSVPEVDLVVDTLLEVGALGARMTGGGFGGSVVALVPLDRLPALAPALGAATAGAGHPTPEVHVVRPADGARRDG